MFRINMVPMKSVKLKPIPKLKLPIVFENQHYIVVNKPAGMNSQHSKSSVELGSKNEVVPALIDQYPDIKTVHRLDTRVTGGFLVARGKRSAQMFSANLREGGNRGYKFTRRYVALIPLMKLWTHSAVEYYNEAHTKGEIRTSESGSLSTTKFIVPQTGKKDNLQLIVLQLESGRKHQIRKHLSEIFSSPIINDTKYKSGIFRGNEIQLGLHSSYIYTKVGLQVNKHFIPVIQGVKGLWKGFVDEDGQFNDEVIDLLENFDDRLVD